MSTLLLRLAGPMQAWGTSSRFERRDAGGEPSKSGVVGLLAAALGRPREADMSDLAALSMGVRVDRPGRLMCDYQTALGVARVKGKESDRHDAVESMRDYLADADFLVGLEGDRAQLEILAQALARPRWPLFLGRRAFQPGLPVDLPLDPPLGPPVRDEELQEVLSTYPWLAQGDSSQPAGDLLLVLEVPTSKAESVRLDQPVGRAFSTRRFAPRGVVHKLVSRQGVPVLDPFTTAPVRVSR